MSYKFLKIIIVGLFIGLFSCQDKENRGDSDTEIFPAEEKKDELREDDRPMPRSYLLAKMRENDELSTFTEELKRTGLEEEFEGKEGIYTIFAPSNAAYDRIPAKEMKEGDTLEAGENQKDLLRYYMVEGELTLGALREEIRTSEDGRYEFETALGEKLWAVEEGDDIVLIDVLGNKAKILTSKMEEYYGAYHIIDNVLVPGENSGTEGQE
ncbi:fasciclin domain-containing protein [Salinimicrobium sp. TH3]|uniref:fasciclin domain-containing protein n=1 Tax=Salinimicrobium sp. TH3 TaxID=2997342 RepID=UPI00227490F8|nr:fasciclin domain-containing protein [Salinimicrobium sp. TH3]MCY2688059.1 fasciclin domain-containing protein [Salinimicrobium sp. TH3]